VRAGAAERPVLVLLEDVHWGDVPSFKLFEAAVRELAELPWMILALGRPEASVSLDPLAAHARVLKLSELGARSSEKLVRLALGESAKSEDVRRIVGLAAGNPLYLEELVRAAAEGRGDLPETVLAIVQSRIEGLESDARRILRAASVFGETFWARSLA